MLVTSTGEGIPWPTHRLIGQCMTMARTVDSLGRFSELNPKAAFSKQQRRPAFVTYLAITAISVRAF